VAKQIEMEEMMGEYQDLWGECQKCQGSVTMDILCSNVDCPIYYRRIKVKNELKNKKNQVHKLNLISL
jgi:DNA polymerase delta subunit 1